MARKVWTKEEILYLQEHANEPIESLCKYVHRDKASVKAKLQRISESYNTISGRLTDKEKEYIKQHANDMYYKDIARKLNRKPHTIRYYIIKHVYKRDTIKEYYVGCDEDCWNCPYSDCIKPEQLF